MLSFEIRTVRKPGHVASAWIFGSECEGRMYLGSERLATDPDDRDITGALRQFNLPTAVAPGEWPNTPLCAPYDTDENGLTTWQHAWDQVG